MNPITQDTLDALKLALSGDGLSKSPTFQQSSGLVYFDLSPVAKVTYPVITPLRNMIPRVAGGGDTATRWKAITAININNVRAGVSEGNRGGFIDVTVNNFTAAYKGLGLEANVTFEADYAAVNFDDARARAVESLMRSVMIQEERVILDGNASLALGTTPTPALVASTTGGNIATSTQSVICVALTSDGFRYNNVAGGLTAAIARTNADATVDNFGGGVARKSTAATVAVTGPTGSLTAVVAPVTGATAYAWYWGLAGSELLGAITTVNSVLIAAAATGTQNASALPAADNSQNALIFDGIYTQTVLPGNNGYVKALANGTLGTGSGLTADGAGGIVEIDAALKDRWDTFRLSPDKMFVNSQELMNITKKIIANGGSSIIRFTADFNAAQGNPTVSGGTIVGTYLNKFTMAGGQLIPIMLHPDVPPGTVIMTSSQLPYPVNDIPNVWQIKTRQEYYQMQWPLKARRYEYGVYVDEVLQGFFPPANAVITNIGNV